jgi:hypothetical protein
MRLANDLKSKIDLLSLPEILQIVQYAQGKTDTVFSKELGISRLTWSRIKKGQRAEIKFGRTVVGIFPGLPEKVNIFLGFTCTTVKKPDTEGKE